MVSLEHWQRAILEGLKPWFETKQRDLPWRSQPSVYRVWISEIMLQQTQVKAVVPYFERFVSAFPDLASLARAPLDQVLNAWAGLGYYSRARNLHQTAQILIQDGSFPSTLAAWCALPGIGPYTAGAIVSIALNQPVPLVDGNVERVLSRLRTVDRRGGDASYKKRLWRLARMSVEEAHRLGVSPSLNNQALMELGAMICLPRNPHCAACPINAVCRAHRRNQTASYPPPKTKKVWRQIEERSFCYLDPHGRILLRKRQLGEWRAGLWDLPDAPVVDIRTLRGSVLMTTIQTQHVVTRHRITRQTELWLLHSAQVAPPAPLGDSEFAWFNLDELRTRRAHGSALRKTLTALESYLPR